jgi:hypothetical protein
MNGHVKTELIGPHVRLCSCLSCLEIVPASALSVNDLLVCRGTVSTIKSITCREFTGRARELFGLEALRLSLRWIDGAPLRPVWILLSPSQLARRIRRLEPSSTVAVPPIKFT